MVARLDPKRDPAPGECGVSQPCPKVESGGNATGCSSLPALITSDLAGSRRAGNCVLDEDHVGSALGGILWMQLSTPCLLFQEFSGPHSEIETRLPSPTTVAARETHGQGSRYPEKIDSLIHSFI